MTYKKEKTAYLQKENIYKNQLNIKQKEIIKLQAKIKALYTNHRNDSNNNNNNSNLSVLLRSKASSTFCTINKDEIDHNNKLKVDDIYNIYNINQNNDNNYNKNRTMSNIKPSRNSNNYFTLVNKPLNKNNNINNNISQQNTIININSYLQKNFS